MTQVILDFESYSPVPITSGTVKYAAHEEADVVCFAYKEEKLSTRLWTPGDEIPDIFFSPDTLVYAHNAYFDYNIWARVARRRYGFPDIPLARWVDSAALCNRYNLPGSLANAGDVLDVAVQKDKAGKSLIRKICIPNKHGLRPLVDVDFSSEDLYKFYDYCIQDVDSTYHLINNLPSSFLSDDEQLIWLITQEINLNGLPIDVKAVDVILKYVNNYIKELSKRIPEITNGAVERITQTKRVVDFISSRGVSIDNLQAPTVAKLLETDLPEDVSELLELRQAIGKSSIAKYKKLLEMEHESRVHSNLHYHGAGPGRWAGRGFQLQNLPRASVDDPVDYINKFLSFTPIDDPVNVAKALIRPMIKAPAGRALLVSDYASIENRLLAWVAGDLKALELFRNGGDQYVDMAAFLYNKRPQDVTKSERQMGKIIILGCGYGMGAKQFVVVAESWGVAITLAEAEVSVRAYRERYSLVRKLWYALKNCAVSAIRNPNKRFTYNNCSFKTVKCRAGNVWLVFTLPSGRNIFYAEPSINVDQYGPSPSHMGINPYTKKWSKLKLIPGRITENAIQGLARDVLANGIKNVYSNMTYVDMIGLVHDETIGEVDIDLATEETLREFNYQLCKPAEWALGIPLEADGFIAERYRK